MAGIIDIRYNVHTRRWTAKPRFVWSRETMEKGAPSVEGITPNLAVAELIPLLPEEMGRKLGIANPQRIYRSPEYEWKDDKCIEVDGHCPNRNEWGDRRRAYLRKKQLA